jgi:acetyltransferase-like isoleucine patch superfamily enzyme
VEVHGPLRLRGPGRIVIGAGTVLGPGPVDIEASGPGVVHVGADCRLSGVRIHSSDNVTIGDRVHVRDHLHIENAGRVSLGDDCDIAALDIQSTGDVTIGTGVQVRGRASLEDADRVAIGSGCKLQELYISAGGDVTIGADVRVRSKLQLGGNGRVVIGDTCVFETAPAGTVLHAAETTSTIRIGSGCGINGLDVYAGEDVTIGDRCMIGTCSIMTTDFHSTGRNRWGSPDDVKRGAVTIGRNVWLADRTVITKDVSIGDNSVVSIGTVVREDVPADVIVSSHQQRIVKELPRSE